MKILFLDIDGVLNSVEWMESDPGWEQANDRSHLDPAAVQRLQTIVEQSGAKVVISSSKRKLHACYGVPRGEAYKAIQGLLRHHGFLGEVIGETPHWLEVWERPQGRYQRGWEISAWLGEHPEVTHFAILDDDSDMDGVEDHFVHTKYPRGLQDEHIPQVLALLNVPA